MTNNNIVPANLSESPFDAIRRFDEAGNEYWMARELMPLLGYKTWQKFCDAIERAKSTCSLNEEPEASHISFLPVSVKSAGRSGDDYRLSRQACYWVAMAGDTRKLEIAQAHKYFVVKTREAEVAQQAPMSQMQMISVMALQIDEQNKQLELIKQQQTLESVRIDELAQLTRQHDSEIDRIFNPNGHYFSVVGYARNRGILIGLESAKSIGKECTKYCKEFGIKVEKLADARYGTVGSYPESVIAQYF